MKKSNYISQRRLLNNLILNIQKAVLYENAVLLTYYSNDTSLEKKDVKLSLKGLGDGAWEISFYLLDETRDNELVRKEYASSDGVDLYLELPQYSTYLVKLSKI